MSNSKQWQHAQQAEGEYWSGLTAQEEGIRHVLQENREVAARISAWLPVLPNATLEIGVGGLGIGALGFLKQTSLRVGMDPLPPPPLICGDSLRAVVLSLRKSVHLVTAQGERLPFPDGSFGLVLCSNVLDHVCNPQSVVAEAYRVLQPGGYFYLAVDVFSFAGLVKWYLWTRWRRKKEILVRAHPYRFREPELLYYLCSAGFRLINKNEVSLAKRLCGRSWDCLTLAQKPADLNFGGRERH
ncbi:MAG: class I SAM-dependent methyltransferase [Acidobacteriia bacterium]|nr:class I SAM-dependent methyltransferase [Terriglobia bacterium]